MTGEIKKIGVFDSGVGGLTVLKELVSALPQIEFIYLGDTARVPYGIRSPEIIRNYSLQDSLFLIEHDVDLIVVACNTASSHALDFLRDELDVPVAGVIEPGVKAALQVTKNHRVGIIGTEATIASQVYEHALQEQDKRVVCFAKATPLFVPLVEEGIDDPQILIPIFSRYLDSFRDHEVDTVILGCTHYPLLKKSLAHFFGDGVRLVDSAKAMAAFIKDDVEGVGGPKTPQIYMTDAGERVQRIVHNILDFAGPIQKVSFD